MFYVVKSWDTSEPVNATNILVGCNFGIDDIMIIFGSK